MRVVLDTNVIVSGLLSPHGPPGRVLDLMQALRVIPLYDDCILAEYDDVLFRPRLGIAPEGADGTVTFIRQEGLQVSAPPLRIVLPDPTDLAFVEVAAAGGAEALVTGHGRHFAPARFALAAPILAPAEFMEVWRTR